VLARGRNIITAEGKLTDSRGRLLAHGTSTIMVLRPEGKNAP
jgi:acyl-coenzyme A thioesterase PaaI-like protein